MNVAPGAWRYATVAVVLAIPAIVLSPWLSMVLAVAAAFTLWFFRDPDRTPDGPGVLAPADGRVSVIREESGRLRVGIFMNVTDVHVNRAPMAGTVEAVEHTPGAHRPAFTKDSDRNERVRTTLDTCEVVQIAGTFARRITPYVESGDDLARGDRLGHIAFGSRCDVLLPEEFDGSDLLVDKREHVRAGETVIARRESA